MSVRTAFAASVMVSGVTRRGRARSAARPTSVHQAGGRRRGFTLAELLVAMAIIGIIAAVTVIAVGKISQDARVSSGINTITAGLDNARALAMKEGKLVALVFRPHRDGNKQHMELILTEWTGDAFVNGNDYRPGVDRFIPIKNIAARRLPDGINVAAPQYYASGPIAGGLTADFLWTTQVNLGVSGNGVAGEGRGSILAVMFDGAGTVVTDNQASDSIRLWVDFDDDGLQEDSGTDFDNDPNVPGPDYPNVEYFDQVFEDDEPYATHAVFIAVYDDQFVREQKTLDWTTDIRYTQELLGPEGLITTYSDRLYFNRFTGVVMHAEIGVTRMMITPMNTTPRRSSTRSGFTLTELLIAVAVLVAIILAISKIFSTTSDVVGLGEATADVLQEKNAIDRQLRTDLQRLTHEGVFVIRCIGVRNDAYLGQQGRLLNPALPPNAEVRSDQLVFFANGAESTRTFQPGEGLNQKGQSAVSRIYFGHAFQLGEQGAAADYNGGIARAFDPVPGGEPIYPWSFQANAVRTSYDFGGGTFQTSAAGEVRLPPIDARNWLLARQAVILADDGSDSGGNDPTEYLNQTTTALSIFLIDQDLQATVFPVMQGRVDGAVTQMNDVRRQILFNGNGNARTWFEQRDRILGADPIDLSTWTGGLVYHPRGERIAPGMGRVDQALTAHVMGTACSSVKIEWTYDRGVGQVVDRNGFVVLRGFAYDATEPRPWFGLPDYGPGTPDPGEDVILYEDLENFALQYDVPAIYPRNVERYTPPTAGLRFYEAVFGFNQDQAVDRSVDPPAVTPDMGFTPWPSALRITLTLHDGDTKLESGEVVQFIINLPDRSEPAIF